MPSWIEDLQDYVVITVHWKTVSNMDVLVSANENLAMIKFVIASGSESDDIVLLGNK